MRLANEHSAGLPPTVVIAAPASGTGKTVFTLGLIAALRAWGLEVACAKVGPDFIDPKFHARAAGRPCYTLDPWAMSCAQVCARAVDYANGADVFIIEGVMGLYDGAANGAGSTADLAQWLGAPIILCIDAGRQGQSIAATVHGFSTFRKGLTFAGVVACQTASERHLKMISAAMEPSAFPSPPPQFLGGIARNPALTLASRHLGLVQAEELEGLDETLTAARLAVELNLDLPALWEHLKAGPARAAMVGSVEPTRLAPLGQRIAVAVDRACAFAYPHMLADWQAAGAQILPFSPLANEAPDRSADAIFLPGGYPELHAGQLARGARWRQAIRAAADNGTLIYGECGGYMLLGKALIDAYGTTHPMLGLLDHTTSFAEPRRTLGYRTLDHDGSVLPWPRHLRGHEFRYSSEVADRSIAPGTRAPALFAAHDATGSSIGAMGASRGRIAGSYAHVIAG